MATENPESGQRPQDGGDGGKVQGLRERARAAGDRLREGYDSTSEALAHRYRRAEGMIARNPAPSVLLGFGTGFALGLALTALLTRSEEESWYERHVPDSLRGIPERVRELPERIREMQLPESVARYWKG